MTFHQTTTSYSSSSPPALSLLPMMFDINDQHYHCTNCKHYYYYCSCSSDDSCSNIDLDGSNHKIDVSDCNLNVIKTNSRADRVLMRDCSVLSSINKKV